VKRLAILAASTLALMAAACSGGGGNGPLPPPAQGPFSNASLKGQYAFSMSGEDLNGRFITRVGSFNADGNGTITAAIEDVNAGGAGSTVVFNGGSYTIQSDGRGVLTLGSALSGLGLSIVLNSVSQGFMVQTDLNASSSGSFLSQRPSDFLLSAVQGSYVFSASGVNLNAQGAPLTLLGQVSTNGAGSVNGGVFDVNDGSQAGPSGPLAITGGIVSMDPQSGPQFGRGTISFGGLGYAFYIVDSTRFRMIETDGARITSGDAVLQTGAIPATTNAFSGNFAYLAGGAAVVGNFGSVVRGGRFTASNGALTSILVDDNDAGTVSQLGPSIANGNYTIDARFPGSGRGTATFTDSHNGTFSYVFYLNSPQQGVIEDISNGLIANGTLGAQSATTGSALAGNYAFTWSGQTLPSGHNVGFEEDFVGQYAQTSSGAITGAMDFSELGSDSQPVFRDIVINGTFTVNGDGTQRNAYQIKTGNSPSTTFNYSAYIVNGAIYLVCIDNTRVTAGTVVPQS
jgi:hypothetical protein